MKEIWGYTGGSFSILVMTMSSVIIYASCGVFQFTLTFQLSTYLKILQNQIETKGAKDKTIYSQHSNITQFIQAYNDIFTGQLLIELMVASLMPCGYSYTIIKGLKSNNPPPLDIYHNLLLTLIGPLIMYICGQEISTQMERLHDSSYFSKWYEEKPKVRRDLYTMMLATVRPMKPNYRLFITFDMKCCTTVNITL
ncbi:hypothetical protein O3M35_009777 [Rhynocoris fuscipes]|uniref:Uncharacterized protein n=1 Tax=Rhynocoris fuscipes TaxID=488301 RepID=A0AAW1D6V2_9HEMI